MVDLTTLDLFLDVLLKGIAIVLLVFIFLMLRNLDRAVQSLERSFESMERSADTVEDLIAIARYLPFVGGRRDK
jgi:Na+-transporting methylmalonyl-CoA/oxaloacetate decarboxylase gamma subunit